MGDVLYILFLSWVVSYSDFKMTKHNWGSMFNGLGALPLALAGKLKVPMQYRILVAWLCRWLGIERQDRDGYIKTYFYVRLLAIVFAMTMAFKYFEVVGVNPMIATGILSAFFVWVAMYDYTDVYFEVGFFAAAFTCLLLAGDSMICAIMIPIITFIAGLNRETAVFIPVACLLFGFYDIAFAAGGTFLISYVMVRQIYGKRERYCEFFMVPQNIKQIRKTYNRGQPFLLNEYSHFFGVLLAVSVLYSVQIIRGVLTPIEISMGVMFVLLLVPSIWREVRVFAPVTLALIPMVLR